MSSAVADIITPPLAIDGPALTIRKFKKDKLTLEQLVRFGSISPEGADVLKINSDRCPDAPANETDTAYGKRKVTLDLLVVKTVTSFTAASWEPPLVLVCVDQYFRAHDLLVDADAFAVSVLSERQEFLAERFAGRAPGSTGRFEDVPPGGLILPMSAAYPTATPPGPAGRWFVDRLKTSPGKGKTIRESRDEHRGARQR